MDLDLPGVIRGYYGNKLSEEENNAYYTFSTNKETLEDIQDYLKGTKEVKIELNGACGDLFFLEVGKIVLGWSNEKIHFKNLNPIIQNDLVKLIIKGKTQ